MSEYFQISLRSTSIQIFSAKRGFSPDLSLLVIKISLDITLNVSLVTQHLHLANCHRILQSLLTEFIKTCPGVQTNLDDSLAKDCYQRHPSHCIIVRNVTCSDRREIRCVMCDNNVNSAVSVRSSVRPQTRVLVVTGHHTVTGV